MSQDSIKLSEIIEGLQMAHDGVYLFLDRQKGRVDFINDEDIAAAEDDERAEKAPEWQQETIEWARQIDADDDGGSCLCPLHSISMIGRSWRTSPRA